VFDQTIDWLFIEIINFFLTLFDLGKQKAQANNSRPKVDKEA